MSLQGRVFDRILNLPPAISRSVTVTRGLRLPAYDGVELLADLYSPRRVPNAPTILVRTPYGRGGLVSRAIAWPFAERGYHVLIATVRGTDGAGGEFDPFRHESPDGLATLDWLEKQPWHNGKVLLFGPSYLAHVQFALAAEAGDRITAMVPVIGASAFRDAWYYGDSFQLAGLLAWTARMTTLENHHPLIADVRELTGDPRARTAMDHLPLTEMDIEATGKRAHWWQSWLTSNRPNDPYWGPEREHRDRIAQITAPIHQVGGWYDILLLTMLDDYAALRAAGHTPHLTIGPWLHVDTEVLAEGTRQALTWFRAHVTGHTHALREQPVRLYVQGAEEWRDYADWPPPGTIGQTWYLQPDHGLALNPSTDDGPAVFRYDQADPTPTIGGPLLDPRTGGRKDNTNLEARPDVLTYTSQPLPAPLEVIGPVSARVRLRTSTEHADVFIRLCDVDPDGRSTNVCDGLQRITPEAFPADPDGVRTVPVRLWPTAYQFRPGHRLRIQISGGSFPRFPRNTGTGDPLATANHTQPIDYEILPSTDITLATQPVPAQQTLPAVTGAPAQDERLARWLATRRTASAKVPTSSEVAGFRHAQGLAFRCAQEAAAHLRPGWTEGQTQLWMRAWLHDHNVRAHLHKPIVAFGERTLAPDAQWGPARGEGLTLREHDVAILDCAPVVDGYTGDIAYTVGVGDNPELQRAQEFLSALRARLPQQFANPDTASDVFAWVDNEIRNAGYDNAVNGYVGHVMGHRVYRHGPLASRFPWFPPERPFGWIASWHGPGFLLKVIRRWVYPEELGPLHRGPKTGMWAVEPHLRLNGFGCKFEEQLVVEDGNAYWLDDLSQRRITIQP